MTTVEEKTPMDVDATLKARKGDSYMKYLLETRMSRSDHIPCRRTILTANVNDLATDAFHNLSTEGFQSAPVMDFGKCIGFIDMQCLVKYITDLFGGASSASWVDFWSKRATFARATVGDVMSKTYYNIATLKPECCYEDNTTFHAMEAMTSSGAHRIAILNNRFDKKLVGIFTQSMVISELRQRQSLVATLLNKKVSQCVQYWKPVKTILDTELAINGFKRMANTKMSGLAIVNADGVLEDTLSVSDLKAIGSTGDDFEYLFKSVKKFKEFAREKIVKVAPKAHYSGKPTPLLPLYVTPKDTLKDVLEKMDDGNIHRIWLCSEESVKNGRPIADNVITQTDFIRLILENYAYTY